MNDQSSPDNNGLTKPKAKASQVKSVQRRQFLETTARGACAAAIASVPLTWLGRSASAHAPLHLRPPGAIDEEDFLGACLKCGLCVRDCPYDTLLLADVLDPIATGTPYFIARDVPCEMCEDIPCVKACPSGALDPELTNIDDADMGLAALVDEETCLNFIGLRCDICYRVCPSIDKAITIEYKHNERTGKHAMMIPVVHSDSCTGCGKCEHSCILDEAAIKVFPRKLVKGKGSEHYPEGWQSQEVQG